MWTFDDISSLLSPHGLLVYKWLAGGTNILQGVPILKKNKSAVYRLPGRQMEENV